MIWLIAKDGRRVSASEADAAGMVRYCGYKYEKPLAVSTEPVVTSFVDAKKLVPAAPTERDED